MGHRTDNKGYIMANYENHIKRTTGLEVWEHLWKTVHLPNMGKWFGPYDMGMGDPWVYRKITLHDDEAFYMTEISCTGDKKVYNKRYRPIKELTSEFSRHVNPVPESYRLELDMAETLRAI